MIKIYEKTIPHIFRNKYLRFTGTGSSTVITGYTSGSSTSTPTTVVSGEYLPATRNEDGTYTVDVSAVKFEGHVVASGEVIAHKDGSAASGDGSYVTVLDTLESDSTTDALSAAQGKVLKGMIDNIDYSNYYTKNEINDKLSNVNVDLSYYYTKDEVYNKEEIDQKLENIKPEDIDIDLSNYYTKEEVDDKIDDIIISGGDVDLSKYYTKDEVDQKIEDIDVDLSEYYTKTEVYNKDEVDEKVGDLTSKTNKISFISPCSDGRIKPVAGISSSLMSYQAYGIIIDTGKPYESTEPLKIILSGKVYILSSYSSGERSIGDDGSDLGAFNYYTNYKLENLYSIVYITPSRDGESIVFGTSVEHCGHDCKENFYVINYNGNLGLYWNVEINQGGRGSSGSIYEIFDLGIKIPEIEEYCQTNTVSTYLSKKDPIYYHKEEAGDLGISSIIQIVDSVCPIKEGEEDILMYEVQNDQYYQIFSLRNAVNFNDLDTYLSLYVDVVIADAETGEYIVEEPGAFVDLWFDGKKVVYEVISPARISKYIGNISMGFPVFNADSSVSYKLYNVMTFFKASWSNSFETWFSDKKVYLRFKILNKSRYDNYNIFIDPVRMSSSSGYTYGLSDENYYGVSRGRSYSEVKEVKFYDTDSYLTNKLDILNTYTKDEVDVKLVDLRSDIITGTDLVNYYTKTEVDNKIKAIVPGEDTDPETEASEMFYIEESGIYSIFKTNYEGDYLVNIVCTETNYAESYTFLYNCVSNSNRLTLINGERNVEGYLFGIGCNYSGTLYLDIRGAEKFWRITIKSLSNGNIVKSGSGVSVLSLSKIEPSYLDIHKFYNDLTNINLNFYGSGYYSTDGNLTLLNGDIITKNGIIRGNSYSLNTNGTTIPLINDSLTSTNNYQALSANQGRVLNEKINEILYISDNLDTYYTKDQVDSTVSGLNNRIDNTNTNLSDNYYTKTQVDQLISDIEVPEIPEIPDMTNYYDKAEVDALISGIEISGSGGSKTVTYSLASYKYTKILSIPSTSSGTVNLTICSSATNGRVAVFQISRLASSGIFIEQLTGVGNNGFGDLYYKLDSTNKTYNIYLENPYSTNNVTLVATGCNFTLYETPTTISSSSGYTRFETENSGMVVNGLKTDYSVQSYQNFSEQYYVLTPNDQGTYDSYDLVNYIKGLENRISELENKQ